MPTPTPSHSEGPTSSLMSRLAEPRYCVGSPSFRPDTASNDASVKQQVQEHLANDDLYNASRALLGLPQNDDYVYHATASVRLAEVQHIVSLGAVNGLHAWYKNEDGSAREPPPRVDIDAYISIYRASTATPAALKNLATNAKKGSLRLEVGQHLTDKRFLHPAFVNKLTIPKTKNSAITNPYLDFWEWSCHNLEWCGPGQSSEKVLTSHHVLPIFMHHFGCVTPSHESLEILKILADGREVADIGSGNGYWAFMLRRYGVSVHAVDNMQSEWRVKWVNDTEVSDGCAWLKKHGHGKNMVLLLVYPVVGGASEGAFTRDLIRTYKGDTIAVVGTQNGNGYTGFKSMTMDQYMEREQPEWTRIAQVSLPSFPGKDEALYIFQRETKALAAQ